MLLRFQIQPAYQCLFGHTAPAGVGNGEYQDSLQFNKICGTLSTLNLPP